MAVMPTGSHRNLLSPAGPRRDLQDPVGIAPASERQAAPRRSFKPADVAVHQAGLWARSRGASLRNEALFEHRFGVSSQAGRAMDRALKELAPGMFDAVVRTALQAARQTLNQGPSRDRQQRDPAGEALADALFNALSAAPPLRQFLHKLCGAIQPQQARQSPAYCALAYCGLKPALEALRAQVGDAAGRRVVDGMLGALPNLRMKADAGHRLSQLLDEVKENGPAPAVLEALRRDQLLAHTADALEAVRTGVQGLPADQPANAGKAVLLSPAWAPARTHIEAVMKVGAGDVLEDLVGRLAVKAQAQRKGGADLVIFFATHLQADLPKLLQAFRPSMGLLREVQASVNAWARGELSRDTRDSVLPNIVMVLGLARAAKARAAFADGAHRQALEVLAKVACAVAQGDAAILTRWLWPGQAEAVRRAVGATAEALRNGLREVTAPTVRSRTPASPVDNKHTSDGRHHVSGDYGDPMPTGRPLDAPVVKARGAVQATVSKLSAVPHCLANAGESVLLSPAWSAARTEIEAAMKAGAGQFFEQLARRLARQAREERMDSTDMALFFARQLRFALPTIKDALRPLWGLMHGVQADVNKSALVELFPLTRDCVLPNMVMVLGLAQAATAQATLLADGAGKQALETLAKVARAVAHADDEELTRGLRAPQALAVHWAVHDTARALRKVFKEVVDQPASGPKPAVPAGTPVADSGATRATAHTESKSRRDSPIHEADFRVRGRQEDPANPTFHLGQVPAHLHLGRAQKAQRPGATGSGSAVL